MKRFAFRLLAVIFLIALCVGYAEAMSNGSTSHAQPSKTQQFPGTGASDNRGSQDTPLVVKVLPPEETEDQAKERAQDRADKAYLDRKTLAFNQQIVIIGYGQLAIIVLQLFVFGYQAYALRETVKAAAESSKDMKATIAHAGRSAVAMERVSDAMTKNTEFLAVTVETNKEIAARQKLITELQSRAWITVQFKAAFKQNTSNNFRFEIAFSLVNVGSSPAYDVQFRLATDVLPYPLDDNFTFPLPSRLPTASSSLIASRQDKGMTVVADKLYPGADDQSVTNGSGTHRVFVWGEITYKDAFKIQRETKFCQYILWNAEGKPTSFDTKQYNDAT